MRRKTIHASLPQRRVRASEGFMDGAKFASMELSSTLWSGRSQHGRFKDFLDKEGSHLSEPVSRGVTRKVDQESQTCTEYVLEFRFLQHYNTEFYECKFLKYKLLI